MENSGPESFERVCLKGYPAQSQTTVHGWSSFYWGLIPLGIGVYCFVAARLYPEKVNGPLWVMDVIGLIFFCAGVFLSFNGLRGLVRQRRRQNGIRKFPNEPWRWDYKWNRKGVTDNKGRQVASALLMIVAVGLFLSIANYFAFFFGADSWILKGIVGFSDIIIGLALFGNLYKKMSEYLKYGNRRLLFQNFPFFLGSGMSVTLEGLPADLDKLSLDLRFIEENYSVTGTGEDATERVVCYQLYKRSRALEKNDLQKRKNLQLEWDLPADENYRTQLSLRKLVLIAGQRLTTSLRISNIARISG